MPPSNSIVEGCLTSPTDIALVQHKEVMEALRLIQDGQKDFDRRLACVEYKLLKTTEGLDPPKASSVSDIFQKLWHNNNCDSGGSQRISQDSRDVELEPNNPAAPVPPIIRTRDIKDQMIEEEQERRERMHEAIDQMENANKSVAW